MIFPISAIRRPLGQLLGLVFPVHCAHCGRTVATDDGRLCVPCHGESLRLMEVSHCQRCGQDAGPYALRPSADGSLQVCGLCESIPLRYAAMTRVAPYVEPVSSLIRRFKYAGAEHLSALLGQWQSARLEAAAWIGRVDMLMAVPMHWRRRFSRGYNQSELLVEVVARRLKLPIGAAMTRPVHRPPQASLPRSRRFENVRGVFAIRRPELVTGRTVCLIDDVCTTGATLSEAARTLLAAGAREVFAAVVAVAQPPPAYSSMLGE